MKMRTLTAAVLSRLSPLVPGSATAQVVRCPRSISGRGVAGGRKLPPPVHLLDEDLEEKFVKGSGPGGQKINKVRNCVQLTHKPTGITVSCQEARELHANRSIARTRLREKVEFHLNGEQSKTGRRIAKIRNRKAKSRRKSRLKHQGDVSPTGDACDRKASSPGQRRPEPSSGSSCDSGSDRDSDYDSDSCDDDGHDDNDGESGGKEDGRTPTKNTRE